MKADQDEDYEEEDFRTLKNQKHLERIKKVQNTVPAEGEDGGHKDG